MSGDSGYAGPRQLRRLLGAVRGFGTDLDLAVLLRRIVETAVELVGASFGALGVLDHRRERLDQFITVGLPDEAITRIGRLPEGHGILGMLIRDPQPLRLPDLGEHPERSGFPPHHPAMTSFLGVPLFVRGEVYGNLYLTDKAGGDVFTDVDEELVLGLAAAAGVAIENVRLNDRVREIRVLEDRERIARDLHDIVIQRMFATGLTLQSVIRLVDRPEARHRLEQAVDEIDDAIRELRSAIFELHTARPTVRSVRQALLAIGAESADALGFDPVVRLEGPIDTLIDEDVAVHVLAVAREMLSNVARHAQATSVELIAVAEHTEFTLVVLDDGVGPGEARAGGHGTTNMLTRAQKLEGDASIVARPGGGTEVRWRIPLVRRSR